MKPSEISTGKTEKVKAAEVCPECCDTRDKWNPITGYCEAPTSTRGDICGHRCDFPPAPEPRSREIFDVGFAPAAPAPAAQKRTELDRVLVEAAIDDPVGVRLTELALEEMQTDDAAPATEAASPKLKLHTLLTSIENLQCDSNYAPHWQMGFQQAKNQIEQQIRVMIADEIAQGVTE